MRTLDQMEDAMAALYDYRVSLGLEAMVVARRRLGALPPADFSMCTENTQSLGEVYYDYQMDALDFTYENQKPMLDSLEAWIEETYISDESAVPA